MEGGGEECRRRKIEGGRVSDRERGRFESESEEEEEGGR